jgi:hypothetical protein
MAIETRGPTAGARISYPGMQMTRDPFGTKWRVGRRLHRGIRSDIRFDESFFLAYLTDLLEELGFRHEIVIGQEC